MSSLVTPVPTSVLRTPHQQRVIDYFDHTHNDYRRLWGIDRHLGLHCGYHDPGHRRHDDAVTHMNRVLAELASIQPGERVLDAGCGIGGSSFWLARHVGCSVVGVNLHPGQLAQARHLASSHDPHGLVSFRSADFCATELPDASFDVVWALESMCYAEDKRAFLVEAFRLLRPGGRLILADAFLTRDDLEPRERAVVEAWSAGWAIPNVASVARFHGWLEEAGFHSVRMVDITPQVVPSSRRIWLGSVLFWPLALVLYWLGLRSAIQTQGIRAGYYQLRARRLGLGIYAVFLAQK